MGKVNVLDLKTLTLLLGSTEKEGRPLRDPLASISHRSNCLANIMARIKRGDLCPEEQIEMMQKAYKAASRKPRSSLLHKARASEVARRYQIWMKSPVIRPAEPAVKKEADRGAADRSCPGETLSRSERVILKALCLRNSIKVCFHLRGNQTGRRSQPDAEVLSFT